MMKKTKNKPMDNDGAGRSSAGRAVAAVHDDDINEGYFADYDPLSAPNTSVVVGQAKDYEYLRHHHRPPAAHGLPSAADYQSGEEDEAALFARNLAQIPPPTYSTPNFRSLFRHPIQLYQHHHPAAAAMNSHAQSELLPTNNNSRQQLNSNAITYATPTPSPYEDLHLVANEMNAIYENTRPFDQVRDFHQGQLQQHGQIDEQRYPSPPPPIGNNPYIQQQQQQQQQVPQQQQQQAATPESRGEGQVEPKSESDAPSPGRSKPILKPERIVTKTPTGQYQCDWPDCTEEVKTFSRKCEWSKHMDKHDRPYKCPASGCEKLPGFTYSGGLLRHEREVHNKHGGPRKQLNCPHPNCKRHGGKGFSRQENLNEHLRRVHTTAHVTGPVANGAAPGIGDGAEEAQDQENEAQAGQKRKRVHENDEDDIREELKRLRQENDELREELARSREVQEGIQADMQRQLHHLQAAMHLQPRLQQAPAPAATMI